MAASMNGCNMPFENMKKSQGTKRITPSTFARNNLSKGGVNKLMAGKYPDSGSVKAGNGNKDGK